MKDWDRRRHVHVTEGICALVHHITISNTPIHSTKEDPISIPMEAKTPTPTSNPMCMSCTNPSAFKLVSSSKEEREWRQEKRVRETYVLKRLRIMPPSKDASDAPSAKMTHCPCVHRNFKPSNSTSSLPTETFTTM